MDSPLCVLRIASAKVEETSINCNLEHSLEMWCWGIVLVTMSCSKHELLMTDTAFPERTAWVTIAYTLEAPLSINTFAANPKVPQVSANKSQRDYNSVPISSTRMQTLSFTSPTKTILDTSLAFFRSLWIKANSTSSLSAIPAALLILSWKVD